MPTFAFGQRVRTTVDIPDSGCTLSVFVPAGSSGTVIYPLDKWGDIGIVLDGDSSGVTRAYGEDELILIADVPGWLRPLIG